MRRVAGWLGVTEAHAYTLTIGLVIALVTATIGIPPTLRHRRVVSAPPGGMLPTTTSNRSLTVAGAPTPSSDASAPATAPFGALTAVDGAGASDAVAPSTAATPSAPALPAVPSFADGGALGEVHPLATVGQPGAPEGIAVDPTTGGFYVGTDNGSARGTPGESKVLAYSAGGTLVRQFTVMGQRPGQPDGVTGIVLDGTGGLYALDASTARVIRIDLATGDQVNVARIPDVPPCSPADQAGGCELSPRDSAPIPKAAAFDGVGNLFVADTAQGIVWKVTPAGAVLLWDKSVDFVGPTGAGPAGLAFDGKGQLVLVVSASLVGLTGAVYVIPVDKTGAPGGHTRLWQSNPDDTPTGLALGSSGKIYVTSTGTNALVVLNPDGSVVRTVTAAAFDTPTGIAFRGQSVLITNPSATNNDPSHWTVVRAPVKEAGVPLHGNAG
jgi:sugar lactone lactonase YvrE